MKSANYEVLVDREQFMMLMDLGPWDKFKTITNAAEKVVEEVAQRGLGERKLFYIDSDGDITRLIHDGNGKFIDFASSMSIYQGDGY